MKRLLSLFFVVALVAACTQVQKSGKEIITVSILPQKYFVERIAGDRFEVHVITPPGASPETYEPSPRQMKTLSESVIYFANGYLMFEDHLVNKLGRELSAKMIYLSSGIDLIAGDIVDHGDHVHLYGIDPHYWLAPDEVRIVAGTIYNILVAFDPDHKDIYEANYIEFLNDIEKLDEHIKNVLSETSTRTFLIYHPAFEYFARQYGLEQIALEMEGKEPTAAHIKYIVDLAREHGINTVLIQSQFNMAPAEVVAKEIGGKVAFLDPLPEDWLENMYAITHTFQQALNP